ncbi:MAG TPA: phage minor head protein [Chthoniobacterales bacterium]
MPDFLLEPTPHDEAIAFIKAKPAIAAKIFGELLPELRARAFTMAGIEHHDTLQRVRDLVAEIPAGADWDQQKRQIVDEIAPSFVGKRAGYDENGNPIYMTKDDARRHAEGRAELLLRIHGFQAYAAASYRTMDAQRDVFPFWKYQSMGDAKVRDTHAALDGKVLPANSEFWKNHFPPWEWGCRCQVVPMMEDEVDDLRRAEAKRPLEERDVLDGPALAKVEQERKLVLGPNQIFDLRTQREKGKADGYEWSPSELRIPLDTLRARYDADVWAKFEKWAQATGIPEAGATVWEWLGGKALVASGKLAKTAAGATPAPGAVPGRQRSAPVSAALSVQGGPQIRQIVKTTLAAIDAVHDDGALPKIAVDAKTGKTALGEYRFRHDGSAGGIGVRISGPWPRLTAAHEIGHFLDHQVLGKAGRFASDAGGLAGIMAAAGKSQAVGEIIASHLPMKRKAYFLQRHEIFARAYAQWIALRSGDKELLRDLDAVSQSLESWRQWDEHDFAPIAQAMDAFFTAKGWA